MARATWRGAVLAESDDVVVVDGYSYFPREAVRWELLEPTQHASVCGWKGRARYYSAVVGSARNENAAWEYADPKAGAEIVRGRVGFWHGVAVER